MAANLTGNAEFKIQLSVSTKTITYFLEKCFLVVLDQGLKIYNLDLNLEWTDQHSQPHKSVEQ